MASVFRSELLVFSTLFLAACAPRERVFPLRSSFFIEGKIAQPQGVVSTPLPSENHFFWIDRDGIRQTLDGVTFDPSSGQFRFEFKRENLLDRIGQTQAEEHALMGVFRPLERLSSVGFSRNELGYIRFEYLSGALPEKTTGIASYVQSIAGFTMSASLGNTQSLNVASEGLPSQAVGATQVLLNDPSGKVISQGRVSVIPLAVTGSGESDIQPLDFRLDGTFTPVAALTGADGKAIVWPVPVGDGQQYKYQIVAQADGYCPKVTSPMLFSGAAELTTIVLDPCSTEQTAKNEFEFSAEFGSEVFTLSETLGSLPQGTGCTNKDSVELKLKNQSSVIRGLLVQVHEGVDASAPVVLTQVFPVFRDKINVNLPASFANGTTPNGRFFINLKAQLTDLDRAQGRADFSFGLTGDKRVSKFTADAQDFEVKSFTGAQNVISGLPDSTAQVRFFQCEKGQRIGVSINNDDSGLYPSEFIPCDANGTILQRDQLKWRDVFSTKTSGFKRVRYFYSDRYGNRSDDDVGIDKINLATAQIYVDSDSPDVSTVELGVRTAIVAKDETIPVVSTSEAQITPQTLSDFVLAFRSSGGTLQCFAESESNGSEPAEGQTISHFYLGTPKPKNEMFSASAPCATGALPLSADAVVFPADPSAAAVLKLTVFDLAGNTGSGELSIPPCVDAAPSTELVCWKNDVAP